jgi:sporulation protein YlmC with PRC-barrel domain
MMELVRDILDKQLVDREQVKIGKVDGIVIELRRGRAPRVAFLEVGSVALARRLGPRLERWVSTLGQRLGGKQHSRAFRIPWKKVRDIGVDIEVDLDVEKTPIFDWQDWLRRRVISHVPGS